MYALKDCRDMAMSVERWAYLGVKRLQLEHRRAVVGSLWIILGFSFTTIGIGYLLAKLLGIPPEIHVPYVAFGFAVWNFIQSAMLAGCSVFTSNRAIILQAPTPRGGFVLILLVRIGVLMLANLATAAVIAAFFGWRPSLVALEAVPALMMLFLTGYGVVMALGMLCARMPDLTELIASIMRLAFFLTPIIWTLDRRAVFGGVEGEMNFLQILYTYNPFTYFLTIVRDPLLGTASAPFDWVVSVALCLVALISGFLALQFLGRRVAFWV